MGGSDDNDNLVRLTGREHWVAHLLLWKIHGNSQCAHACHMMAMRCEERGIPEIRNSRMYEALRIYNSRLTSNRNKCFAGKNNSQFGTIWICDISNKINRKISNNSDIPPGWVRGRNRWPKDKVKRLKRPKPVRITDGISNKTLYFEDQIIPNGWKLGFTLSDSHKEKISAARIRHNKSLKGTTGQGGRRSRR